MSRGTCSECTTKPHGDRRSGSTRRRRQPDRGRLTGPVGSATAGNPVIDQDSRALQRAVRTSAIFDHLGQLQTVADRYGDRAAGREGCNASSRYVEHELREAGYQPRRQYFAFTYTRVNANTLAVDGTTLDNVVFTGSPSTADGGVTASVVTPTSAQGCSPADSTGVEATGKVVLVSRGACTFGVKSQNATAAGTGEGFAPTTGIDQVSGQAILADLAQGPVSATLDLDITVEQRRTWNVLAETGSGRSGNVVMAGSHLDSVQD